MTNCSRDIVLTAMAFVVFVGIAFAGRPLTAQQPGGTIAFTEPLHEDVREGYVTLEWNEIDDARRYELIDSDGALVYSGPLPQAFLSGLSDGSYQYSVRALSGTNEIIASSEAPAVVKVEHWPMRYVVVLFLVGLVVVIAVVVVIVRGAQEQGAQEQADSEAQA